MKLKKLISGILATTALVGCVGTFAACETSHPEVRITLTFEGKDYELDYTLYRKFAPATVSHFIKLAQEGYYDGLCIHNYADNRLYGGGYSYDAADETYGGLVYKNYFDIVKTYKDFPYSVYAEGNPTYTVCGEFEGNDVQWEHGEPKVEEYGSLTMYYYSASVTDSDSVTALFNGEEKKKSYVKNNATSQFYISLSETAKTNANYCTFGLMESSSAETLTDLRDAISDYLADNEDATTSVTVKCGEDEEMLNGYTYNQTYTVLASPIVIKSVEVTKT